MAETEKSIEDLLKEEKEKLMAEVREKAQKLKESMNPEPENEYFKK